MSEVIAVERPVASPCVSICALDEQDICTGCQRTVAEIGRWGRMDNTERRAVLKLCHERAVAAGLIMGNDSALAASQVYPRSSQR